MNLSEIRELFFKHEAETGKFPRRVHLNSNQINKLKADAERLRMRRDPAKGEVLMTVWGVEIVQGDSGPHVVS